MSLENCINLGFGRLRALVMNKFGHDCYCINLGFDHLRGQKER